MARPTKCPVCSLHFDRDIVAFVHEKNRYYHKTCHESIKVKAIKEREDLEVLEEYIIKLLKLEYIDARIKKQLKTMMEQYSFTYSGIHKTLVYWYEIKKNSIEKANGGLGIVPYVYKDAAKYFYTVYMAQLQNHDKSADQYVTAGRTIRIKPPKREVKEMKTIDLEALEEVIDKNGK